MQDFSRSNIHLDGVERLVRMRGGMSSQNMSSTLRSMALW